jgi:hypothetical protein
MADTLTTTSRAFYERSKAKVAASLVIMAGSMMVLGFMSEASGESNANNIAADNATGDAKDQYEALGSGYGFAAFVYFLAFVLAFTASIYISPQCCGYVMLLILHAYILIIHCNIVFFVL